MTASNQPYRRWLWPAGLLAACLLLTLALWLSRAWIWLGVPPINAERTPFSDTIAQLASAINCAHGFGQWHGRVCFVPDIDTVPRMQAYEPWLSFERWGLDTIDSATPIAVLLLLVFCAALALTLRPINLRESLLGLALFATSGVQLAVERGNFDLLLMAMICLAGAALARPARWSGIAGAAVLSLATMLKLYTGAATALAWTVARAPWRLMLPVSLLAIALAVVVVGPSELLVLRQGAPEGATRFSTGARWLYLHRGATAAISAVIVALVATSLAAFWLRRQRPDFGRWPQRAAVFQIAFLTAVPLFLLKDSYDYRLVLWLPCLALPMAMLRAGAPVSVGWRRLAAAVIVLFFLVAAVELPCYWLDRLQGSGSAVWSHWLAGQLSAGLVYAKQFSSWLLAGLLSLVFCHLQWQRWRG
ncbi:MAG: hypothetical protein M0Q42_11095 [Xanthomonadales bacterium]|nr:hypothetical protein [Xanthomonadales bacterium]